MAEYEVFSLFDDGPLEPCVAPAVTCALGAAPDRAHVVVEGVVHTIEEVRWAGGAVVEVCLADGMDILTLVFFGRRMEGFEPGSQVVAQGRIGRHCGQRVILNPFTWVRARDVRGATDLSAAPAESICATPVP